MGIDFNKATLMLHELHTITLANRDVLRMVNNTSTMTVGGVTYQPATITRGDIEATIETEVTSLEIEIGMKTLQHRGRNAAQMVVDGLFDNAVYTLDFYESLSNATERMFKGYIVSEVKLGSYTVKLSAKSILYKLEQFQLPRIVLQSQCNNTLFDFGCGLSDTGYKAVGTFSDGDRKTVTANVFSSQPDGYWTYGKLSCTSGENRYQSRYIIAHTGDTIIVDKPFWYNFSSGDTFDVTPGCDKLGITCQSKFNNYAHFAGFEFIPQQDTVLRV
jgi:uncharacterized phage protein (TIGR02218 family)